MTPERIELMIDELALDGIGTGDQEGIRISVERELTRLFLEQGIPPTLAQEADIARLEAGSVDFRKGMETDALGARIAQTLYEGLAR